MEPDHLIRDSLVLLLALAQPDGRAIMHVMAHAEIATQLCTAGDLSTEVRAGVGAIVLPEEAMSETLVAKLAALIKEQPTWSDIPLVIPAARMSHRPRLSRESPDRGRGGFHSQGRAFLSCRLHSKPDPAGERHCGNGDRGSRHHEIQSGHCATSRDDERVEPPG